MKLSAVITGLGARACAPFPIADAGVSSALSPVPMPVHLLRMAFSEVTGHRSRRSKVQMPRVS
jgi:hypothetical protein